MKQLYRILFGFILCIGTLSAQGQVKGYEQLIEESYDYLEQDSLEAAARSLTEAMRIEPANPGNFALLTNLGTIQRQLGQLEEALVLGDVDVKEINLDGGDAEVVVAPNDLDKAKEALKEVGVVEFDYCESTMLANEKIVLEGEDKSKFDDLLANLDELEDVQAVYHNVNL